MKSLQEQYNQIKKGKGHKDVFLKEAKRLFPNMISNLNTFDQATTILKQRNVIQENIAGLGIVTDAKSNSPDWHKIFEDNLNKNNYDYTDQKAIDNQNWAEREKGVYFEMEKVRDLITDQNIGDLLAKAKNTVTKNLAKDPLYYIKNAAFSVDKLGYSADRPGLKPTQIKGKHVGSGYGNPSKSKIKPGEPGTGYTPVK
jgi:hypothetical protein